MSEYQKGAEAMRAYVLELLRGLQNNSDVIQKLKPFVQGILHDLRSKSANTLERIRPEYTPESMRTGLDELEHAPLRKFLEDVVQREKNISSDKWALLANDLWSEIVQAFAPKTDWMPDSMVKAARQLRERAQELEHALTQIDEMLDGGLPITHQVKSIARAALKGE